MKFNVDQIELHRKKEVLFRDLRKLHYAIAKEFHPFEYKFDEKKFSLNPNKINGELVDSLAVPLSNKIKEYAQLIAKIQFGINRIIKHQQKFSPSFQATTDQLTDPSIGEAYRQLLKLLDECWENILLAAKTYDQLFDQISGVCDRQIQSLNLHYKKLGNLTARVFNGNKDLKKAVEELRTKIAIYFRAEPQQPLILRDPKDSHRIQFVKNPNVNHFVGHLSLFLGAIFQDARVQREAVEVENDMLLLAYMFRELLKKLSRKKIDDKDCDILFHIPEEQKAEVKKGTFIPVKIDNTSNAQIQRQQNNDLKAYPTPLEGKEGGRRPRIILSSDDSKQQSKFEQLKQSKVAAAGSAELGKVLDFLKYFQEYFTKFHPEKSNNISEDLNKVINILEGICGQAENFKKSNKLLNQLYSQLMASIPTKHVEGRQQLTKELKGIFSPSVEPDFNYRRSESSPELISQWRKHVSYLSWIDEQFSKAINAALSDGILPKLTTVATVIADLQGKESDYKMEVPADSKQKEELMMWTELCTTDDSSPAPSLYVLDLLLREKGDQAAVLDDKIKVLSDIKAAPKPSKSAELLKHQETLDDILTKAREAIFNDEKAESKVVKTEREQKMAELKASFEAHAKERTEIIKMLSRLKPPLLLEVVLKCEMQWIEARTIEDVGNRNKKRGEIILDESKKTTYPSRRGEVENIIQKGSQNPTLESFYQKEMDWRQHVEKSEGLSREIKFTESCIDLAAFLRDLKKVKGSIQTETVEGFEDVLKRHLNIVNGSMIDILKKYLNQFQDFEDKHGNKIETLLKNCGDIMADKSKGFNHLFGEIKSDLCNINVAYAQAKIYTDFESEFSNAFISLSANDLERTKNARNEIVKRLLTNAIGYRSLQVVLNYMEKLRDLRISIYESESQLQGGNTVKKERMYSELLDIYRSIYGEDRTKIIQENLDILLKVTEGVHTEVLVLLKLSHQSNGCIAFDGDLWQGLLECKGQSLSRKRAIIKARIADELLDLSRNVHLPNQACLDFFKQMVRKTVEPFPQRLWDALSNMAQGLEKLRSSVEMVEQRDIEIELAQLETEAARFRTAIENASGVLKVSHDPKQALALQVSTLNNQIKKRTKISLPSQPLLQKIEDQKQDKEADKKSESNPSDQPVFGSEPPMLVEIIKTQFKAQKLPSEKAIMDLVAVPSAPAKEEDIEIPAQFVTPEKKSNSPAAADQKQKLILQSIPTSLVESPREFKEPEKPKEPPAVQKDPSAPPPKETKQGQPVAPKLRKLPSSAFELSQAPLGDFKDFNEVKQKLNDDLDKIDKYADPYDPDNEYDVLAALKTLATFIKYFIRCPLPFIVEFCSIEMRMKTKFQMITSQGEKLLFEFLNNWIAKLDKEIEQLKNPNSYAAKRIQADSEEKELLIANFESIQGILNNNKALTLLMSAIPRWFWEPTTETRQAFFQITDESKEEKDSDWRACFIALQTITKLPSLLEMDYAEMRRRVGEPVSGSTPLKEISRHFQVNIVVFSQSTPRSVPEEPNKKWGTIYLIKEESGRYCPLIPANCLQKNPQLILTTMLDAVRFLKPESADQSGAVQTPAAVASQSSSSQALRSSSGAGSSVSSSVGSSSSSSSASVVVPSSPALQSVGLQSISAMSGSSSSASSSSSSFSFFSSWFQKAPASSSPSSSSTASSASSSSAAASISVDAPVSPTSSPSSASTVSGVGSPSAASVSAAASMSSNPLSILSSSSSSSAPPLLSQSSSALLISSSSGSSSSSPSLSAANDADSSSAEIPEVDGWPASSSPSVFSSSSSSSSNSRKPKPKKTVKIADDSSSSSSIISPSSPNR